MVDTVGLFCFKDSTNLFYAMKGIYSLIVFVANLAVPSNLHLVERHEHQIKVNWDAIDKGNIVRIEWFRYRIIIKEVGESWTEEKNSIDESHTSYNLKTFTNYSIQVASRSQSPYKTVITDFSNHIYVVTKQGGMLF